MRHRRADWLFVAQADHERVQKRADVLAARNDLIRKLSLTALASYSIFQNISGQDMINISNELGIIGRHKAGIFLDLKKGDSD